MAVDRVVDRIDVARSHTDHSDSGVIGCCGCCETGFGKVGNQVDRGALRRGGARDEGLQLAQAVGFSAVVVLGGHGGQHGGQVVWGHTGQAHFDKVGGAECRRGCAIGRCQLQGVGDAGQFVDLGNGVDTSGLLAGHDVAQQGEVVCIRSSSADRGTDGSVLLSGGVGRGGCGVVAGCAAHVVGLGQHNRVGVDDRFDFGGGVGCCAVDGRTGQRVVDGVKVVGVDADHASGHIGGQCRHGARGAGQTSGVALCKSAQVGQGLHGCSSSLGDDGLQRAQRIGVTATVGFGGDGSQHGRQVG